MLGLLSCLDLIAIGFIVINNIDPYLHTVRIIKHLIHKDWRCNIRQANT